MQMYISVKVHFSALYVAAQNDNQEIIDCLLEAGVDLNAQVFNFLHLLI
jgi:ankyrin repeat protein